MSFWKQFFSYFPAQMLQHRTFSQLSPPPPSVCCAQARLCTWPGTSATPARQSFPVRRWESTWRGSTASPRRPARARRWSWPPSENTHTHHLCVWGKKITQFRSVKKYFIPLQLLQINRILFFQSHIIDFLSLNEFSLDQFYIHKSYRSKNWKIELFSCCCFFF